MMYGCWQQSLTLYAQLLFAPAVNPQVEHGKQKKEGICLEEGVWAWHKVKAYVLCWSRLHLWLYTNNTDWESICHWTFHGDNACSSKCPHSAAVPQKSREEEVFHWSRSSGSHIQISLLPKRPGDTLLIATIFQGQELKALCGTFNGLL